MKICQKCALSFTGTDWTCPDCGHVPEIRDGIPCFAPELNANSGYDDDLFATIASYENRHFWFRARTRLIEWAMRRFFPDASTLMEVGCGTGFVLDGLANAFTGLKLTGSDISSAGLRFATARIPCAEFIQLDARKVPFVDEFDVVGLFDVLEHIEEDVEVLHQVGKAVRPGGGVLLTVPQHPFLWSSTDETACHVRRYEADDLRSKIVEAGFTLVRVTSFVSLSFPAMLLARLRPGGSSGDLLKELRIGSLTNALLYGLMSLEFRTIQAGVNWPFGGSLLAVAQKPMPRV